MFSNDSRIVYTLTNPLDKISVRFTIGLGNETDKLSLDDTSVQFYTRQIIFLLSYEYSTTTN